MNTTVKTTIVAVVVVAVLAVLGVGFAFAQGMSPWGGGYRTMGERGGMLGAYQNGTPAPGDGYGMMGNGYGMTNGQGVMAGVDMNTMHQWMADSGGMHIAVWNGLADAIGLTPDELNTGLASGQALDEIAEARGVSQQDLAAALEASVKAGLDQAVADGAFTREQADQMLSQMAGNFEWMLSDMGAGMGFGSGGCHGIAAPPSNS